MTAVSYPYAAGDLLERPHTYFYSEYGGRAFLDAWRAQRDGLRRMLPEAVSPPPGTPAAGIDRGNEVETDRLLEHVFHALTSGAGSEPAVRGFLSDLLKKFEVTKRIHRAYDSGFRAKDRDDHKDPTRYLRLAEVFEAAWSVGGELPYLNALLKCLDTLCTLSGEFDDDHRARLARLIDRERAHVAGVADKTGVSL